MLSQDPSPDVVQCESAVWQRIRNGDEEAWRNVAAAFRQRLRRLAVAKLPAEVLDRVDASDMVQQTFLDADQSYDAFLGRTLPELYAWMVAILKHNISDSVRQHLVAQRRSVLLELRVERSNSFHSHCEELCAADQTSPSGCAVRQENEEQLMEAVNTLSPRQRAAVCMRHLEGRSLTEIAEHLACNKAAAAAVIARGLQRLRCELQSIK